MTVPPGPQLPAWEAYADAALLAAVDAERDGTGEGPGEDLLDAALEEPGPFAGVCALAELSRAEAALLAVVLAVEVSLRRQRLVTHLQDDLSRPRLVLSTIGLVLPAPHPGAVAAADSGRLRRAALLDVESDGPWGARQLGPAPGLLWALAGDTGLDPDLPPGAVVLNGSGGPAQRQLLHLVSGGDRQSRRLIAAGALGGHGLLATAAPTGRVQWDAVVREATMGGLSVLVETDHAVPDGLGGAAARADHLAWALGSPAELPLAELPDLPRRDLVADDRAPTEQEWVAATGAPAPAGLQLDRRQLQLVALGGAPAVEGVRRLAGGHLDRLATRVRPQRGWDDLVLAEPVRGQVRELVARHRQRHVVYGRWGFPGQPSRGTVALLAGPSGTGKTLTAEVVAGELGLDLFVLDLPTVVSKYIGETEKNLAALFDAASAGDAVLFFDEADALFGRRTAVSDAKDRYANVEVAYLLQRLERHDGLVMLATNLPNNIDDAFLRRLHAVLELDPPGPEQRRALWERAFPPGCPTRDLQLDLLAHEADLSGGAITTAAVGAAFAAAAAGEPVTMRRVVAAVAAEYRKLGRLSLPSALAALSPTAPAPVRSGGP